MFLSPECEYVVMDVVEKYFVKLGADKLNLSKIISNQHQVYEQTQALKSIHVDKECEAQILQSVRTIPSTCW
jgi:hypothetical protein